MHCPPPSLQADFTKADRDLAAAKQHKEHYQNGLHSKQAEFTKLQEQILHHEENLQVGDRTCMAGEIKCKYFEVL